MGSKSLDRVASDFLASFNLLPTKGRWIQKPDVPTLVDGVWTAGPEKPPVPATAAELEKAKRDRKRLARLALR